MTVNAAAINRVLDIGEGVLTDATSTGKMRDCYPISLFRLEHVLTLFENAMYAEAIYLLPWTLVFRALLSDVISKRTRIFTLTIALLLFAYFEQSYHPAEKRTGGPFKFPLTLPPDPRLPEQGAPGIEVTPLKWITLVRVMTTIIGIISALETIEADIPLDRISTHPLENFFGLLRRLLHDCNRFEELLHAAARNCVVGTTMNELDHPKDICKRENTGGIVSRMAGGIHIVPKCCAEAIVKGIICSLDTQRLLDAPGDASYLNELESVLDSFHWIAALHKESRTPYVDRGRHYVIRGTSNSKIMASFLQLQKGRRG
jgi:hypothetical protein